VDAPAAAAAAIRIMLLGRFAVLRGVQAIPLREFSGRARVLLVAAYAWRFAGYRRVPCGPR
jgi:hypothetical protein